jgi:uncharacterized protein YbjT (DUF2867 family)
LKKKGTILVTGATGKQGGAVTKHLVSSGWTVRALTRTPDGEKANALRQQGVEIIGGNLDDTKSLEKATDGVYGVFSVQNFWEHGFDGEVRQGKNLARVSRGAEVKHFIYSSVGGAERKSGIPHFESKWLIEANIRFVGLPHTIIRPVSFMENYLRNRDEILSGVFAAANRPDKPLQLVAVDDIGATVAKAFDQPKKFLDEEFELAGDEHTPAQMAEIFSKVIGRPVKFVRTSLEELRGRLGEEGVKMIEWIDREGYKADIGKLRSRYGLRLTSLEEWLRKTGWADSSSQAA